MRALCIGRHRFLAEHLGTVFRAFGLETIPVVGLAQAGDMARRHAPQLVLCDYDLLATVPLSQWERDEILSRIPVVAVSLTRRYDEIHLLDVNGIAGFLYLPTLDPESARRVLGLDGARAPHLPAPREWSHGNARA